MFLDKNYKMYTQEGCLVLLMYSIILTKGVNQIKKEIYDS